jgi:hypothetical protein
MTKTEITAPLVKSWSSCVRKPERYKWVGSLLSQSVLPKVGQLVVVRAMSDFGAYSSVENVYGRDVVMYEGDRFVGVLGNRYSSTNIVASLPNTPLSQGDQLHLVSVGGLISRASYVPEYLGSVPMTVAIEGFIPSVDRKPANIDDLSHTPMVQGIRSIKAKGKIIVVAGTSAESGKTTLACNLIRVLTGVFPKMSVGAIKACGTGRLRDVLRYQDSGANCVADFVDVGLPSTYGIPDERYAHAMNKLVSDVTKHSSLAIIELGGDLLEHSAQTALHLLSPLNPLIFLCVNDALGAIEGQRLLDEAGFSYVVIATMRQNLEALSMRLGVPVVLNSDRKALFSAARPFIVAHSNE